MDAKKRKIVTIVAIVAVALVAIIGYRIFANLSANKERAGRVSQGRAVSVEIGEVARRQIVPVFTFSANLEPVWNADISSKVDGRIDRLLVEEGDAVKAGGVIALLDTAELMAQVVQAEGSLFSAQAGLEQADLDLKRAEALAAQGAVSVQTLDTNRIKRDLARGQLRSAEGNLALLRARLENATVTAPRDGIVIRRHVQSGYYTKAGAPIVTVGDPSSFLAKATAGEGQVTEVSVGTPVRINVAALGAKVFEGTVTRISPAATLPARTFTIEAAVKNDGGMLRTGMFAKVEAAGQARKEAVVVPETALVMREDQKTVYVVTPDNKVRQQLLRLGYVGGGLAEVLDGVKPGDRIVVSGQNKLKDGATIAGAPKQEGAK